MTAAQGENACRSQPTPSASWAATRPDVTGHFQHDADAHSKFWRKGYDLLAALAGKAEAQSRTGARRRDDPDASAARAAKRSCATTRRRSMRRSPRIRRSFVRAERARLRGREPRSRPRADARAGRCARREDAARQGRHRGRSGNFLRQHPGASRTPARISATRCCCRAPKSLARSPNCRRKGAVDLGTAAVMRQGKAVDRVHAQSALSQCRGRGDAAADRDRGRSRDPRSADRALRAARRHRRQSEIRRQARVLAPASISPTSTTARFRTSGTSRARWAS